MKEINRNDDLNRDSNRDMLTTQGGNKMKKMKKLLKNQKGLTLIELLAVIVILAIVAAIAVPAIGNIISNSRDKAILADASNILAGAKLAVIDGACGEPKNKVTTCDDTKLVDVVEGIDVKGASVTKNATTWTVIYPKLEEINNIPKFTTGNFTPGKGSTSISETDLNAAMNK